MPGAHAIPVCDGAGGRQRGARPKTSGKSTLPPLPACSPELHPMKNVWDYPRGNGLSHEVWDTCDSIVEARAEAWHFLIDDPDRIRTIAHREWVCANVQAVW